MLKLLIAVIGVLPCLGVAAVQTPVAAPLPHDHASVRGMTVSCQTNGREWGTPDFGTELERLAEFGVNWVAIHPYATIRNDGRVTWSPLDPENPPAHLAGALAAARERGLSILVKPHLAYWGSPFSWRGEIRFDETEDLERFRETYSEWILSVAEICSDADGFAVGTELEGFLGSRDERFWRDLIAGVRERTDAHLTYAANWSAFRKVRFWDALDCIGVQAYFPLAAKNASLEGVSGRARLQAGWTPWLEACRSLSQRTGKPVVFTELGYDACAGAAHEPWIGRGGHGLRRSEPSGEELVLQELCLDVALEIMDEHSEWLRGALLWKWFVGPAPGADYVLDRPAVLDLLRERWLAPTPDYSSSSSSR